MGDRAALTLAKARQELEELYLGVPDESVNLTFQDFAELNINQQQQQQNVVFDMKKKPITMDPIQEKEGRSSGLGKSTSLDFTKGIQSSSITIAQDDDDDHEERNNTAYSSNNIINGRDKVYGMPKNNMPRRNNMGFESSLIAYDEKRTTMMSVGYNTSPYEERGGRPRRAGIPHSNICTICSTYTYIFRHRCLVCGRVYCRNCVSVGMGEMTEGRKCIQCLGRKFSQRYIERAGQTWCCLGYRSMVKQQELLWAEKGPRRSGFNGEGRRSALYGRSSEMISRPSNTTPVPRIPTSTNLHHNAISSSGSPSFVMTPTSPYNSPRYSPSIHALPF